MIGRVMLALLVPSLAAAQPLVLGAPPPAPSGPAQTCTTVTAGTAQSYACINDAQRALVARQKAGLAAAVPNQNSPAPQLGLYNQAATREQYGAAFGHSIIPSRPPPPVFVNPLIPH